VLRRRWWIWILAAVVLVGLVGVAVAEGIQRTRYGDVHEEGAASVTVDRGHRFSLAVPDRGASVGDHWTAGVQAEGIATLAHSELIGGNIIDRVIGPANGGGAGTRYFVFDARRSGSVAITLHNCFQGCNSDRAREASRDAVWTVIVR
jgi:hypothetical protein